MLHIMVDYNISFRKPFSDFRKLIIGIVLNIIPIVNLISYGYTLESSDIKRGEQSDKMEEWEDLGGFFVKGLLAFIVSLIYSIPALIVGVIAFTIALGPLFGKLVSMGPEKVQMMNSEEFFPMFLPFLLAALPLIIIVVILILIATYVAPVAALNYIKTDKFSEAFNFGKITKYIFNGEYIIIWFLVLLLNLVLVGILSNVPVVGVGIASFITGMIGFSLYASVMIEIDKKN